MPRRVLQVADGRAEVLYDGKHVWVAVRGIPDLKVGEYLVVYAGQALDRVPADDAEEMLRFYAELESMLDAAIG